MMKTVKIVYWQEEDGLWLGYLENPRTIKPRAEHWMNSKKT
jgi:hypothetical protein